MADKKINIELNFTSHSEAAVQNISQLNRSLTELSNGTFNKGLFGKTSFENIHKASMAAQELKLHLTDATNADGALNLGKFNDSLKSAGTSVKALTSTLAGAGVGGQAFLQLGSAIAQADNKIKLLNLDSKTFLSQFTRSIITSLAGKALQMGVDTLLNGVNAAVSYAKKLDSSLNSIRIVTGMTADEMERFALKANEAAKVLSTSTTSYTDASLIYYQQGIRDESEIAARTDATIKMANVTGQSAKTVSEQLTAIWNNFDDGSQSLEYYADVITALGATTASSSAEIAQGLSKFAAIANTTGLSYEYATSALATLVAATRQSADTVGTSLKTLFSRLQGLSLGETLEDGVDLNKYSNALAKVGVNVLDTNGDLRDMDSILDDLANKWGEISNAQKMALAQTVAGVRQYNVLISLMDNWDNMQTNIATASNSEGTLGKQADIYAESWSAASKRVKAYTETIYQDLIDESFFIDIANTATEILDFVDKLINRIGGLKGVLLTIGAVVLNLTSSALGSGIDTILSKIGNTFSGIVMQLQGTSLKQKLLNELTTEYASNLEKAYGKLGNNPYMEKLPSMYSSIIDLQSVYAKNSQNMNDLEKARVDMMIKEVQTLHEQIEEKTKMLAQTPTDLANQRGKFSGELLMSTGTNASQVIANEQYNSYAAEFERLNKELTQLSNQNGSLVDTEEEIRRITQAMAQCNQNMNSFKSNMTDDTTAKHYKDITASIEPLNKKLQELSLRAKAFGTMSENIRMFNRELQNIKINKKLISNTEDVRKKIEGFTYEIKSSIPNIKDLGEAGVAAFRKLEEVAKGPLPTETVEQYMERATAQFQEFYNITSNFKESDYSPLKQLAEEVEKIGVKAGYPADMMFKLKGIINSTTQDMFKAGAAEVQLSNQTMQYGQAIQKAFDAMRSSAPSFGEIFSTTLSGISSVAMGINSLKSAITAFKSGDTLSGITTSIMAFTTFIGVIKKVNDLTVKTVSASRVFESVIKKQVSAHLQNASAEEVEAEAAKRLQRAQAGLASGVTLVITAVVAAAAAIAAYRKAMREAEIEKANNIISDAKESKEQAEANKDLLQTYLEAETKYNELLTAYQNSEATWSEVEEAQKLLEQAAKDVATAYDLQGEALARLTGNYADYTYAAMLSRQAEIGEEQASNAAAQRAAETEFAYSLLENIGGVFTHIGGSLFSNDSGYAALGPGGKTYSGEISLGYANEEETDILKRYFEAKVASGEDTYFKGIYDQTSHLTGVKFSFDAENYNETLAAYEEALELMQFLQEHNYTDITADVDGVQTIKSNLFTFLQSWTSLGTEAANELAELKEYGQELQAEYASLAQNNIVGQMYEAQKTMDITQYLELRQQMINAIGEEEKLTADDAEGWARAAESVDKYLESCSYISNIKDYADIIGDLNEQLNGSKQLTAELSEYKIDDALTVDSIGKYIYGEEWQHTQEQYDYLIKLLSDSKFKNGWSKGLLDEVVAQQTRSGNISQKTSDQATGQELVDSILDEDGVSAAKATRDEDLIKSIEADSSFMDWLTKHFSENYEQYLLLTQKEKETLLAQYTASLQQAVDDAIAEDIAYAQQYVEENKGVIEEYQKAQQQIEFAKAVNTYVENQDIANSNLHWTSEGMRADGYTDEEVQAFYDNQDFMYQLGDLLGISQESVNNMIASGGVNDTVMASLTDQVNRLTAQYNDYLIMESRAQDTVGTTEEENPQSDISKWYEDFQDKIENEDLKYDDLKEYARYLEDIADDSDDFADSLTDNARAALQLAERFKRLSSGVKDLNSNFDSWKEILEAEEKDMVAFTDTIKDMRTALGDVLDIDGSQLSESFFTAAENLELMEKAAEGDMEAIDNLRIAAANDIVQQCLVNLNDTKIKEDLLELQAALDANVPNDLEIGASLDDSSFLAGLESMINAAGMSAEQASAYLASMGVDATVKEVPASGIITREVSVPKIGKDENGYPTLEDGADTRTYTDHYYGTVGSVLQVSNATWGGKSGGGTNVVKSSSSKKSGGSSSKKSKDKKDTSGKDRYHTINEQIQDVTNEINKLSKAESRAFGVSKVQKMGQELEKIAEQADNYAKKLKEAGDYYQQDYNAAKKAASVVGMDLQLGKNGEILNWDELQNAYLEWYNKQVDKYNAGGMDEDTFKTQVEDVYEDGIAAFTQLEETNNLMQELKQNILEAQQQYEDMLLSIAKEKLDIKIGIDDRALELLSYYLKQLNDDLYDGVARMANYEEQMAALMDKSDATKDHINDLLGTLGEWNDAGEFVSYGLSLDDMPELLAMTPDQLLEKFGGNASNVKEIISQLENDYQSLLELNNELMQAREDLINQIGITFSAWNKEIDEGEDKISKNAKLMEHYRNVIDIVGRKTLGITSSFIRDYNEKQLDNDLSLLKTSYAQLQMQEEKIAQMKIAVQQQTDEEAKELMQKQLDEMESAYRDQAENTAQAWEDCMRGIQEAYIDNVGVVLDDWQTKMAGLAGSADMLSLAFDMATDLDDNYLDDYDKIYELNKLAADIGNSIDDEDNLQTREELIGLMEKVNELNESDADISQYTVDILNARYDLLKAEANLREVENNKSQVRMTQDNEGNWGYIYTADQDKVAEAEKEYADKLHALEEINQNYLDDLDQKIADLTADASDKINQIANDSTLTLEEKKQKIQEVYEYTNQMEQYLMEQTTLALEDAQEIYDVDARKYSELTNTKMLDDEKWVNSFEEMKISQITGFKELEDWDNAFSDSWDATVTELTSITDEFVEKNAEAFSIVEMDINNAAEEMSADLDEIADATEELTDSIIDLTQIASDEIGATIDYAKTWSEEWSTQIQSIIEQNERLAKSCTQLIDSLAQAQAASDAADEYDESQWSDGSSSGGGPNGGGADGSDGTGGDGTSGGSSGGWTIVRWEIDTQNIIKCLSVDDTNHRIYYNKYPIYANGVKGTAQQDSKLSPHVYTLNNGTKCATCGHIKSSVRNNQNELNRNAGLSNYTYDTGGYTGVFADTGMYTGEWENGSVRSNGRLAFLHQKELVLNAKDTENFLQAVEIVRALNETIDLNALAAGRGLGNLIPSGIPASFGSTVEQSVSIEASFPSVKDRNEIEEAFNNLINKAAQYANRK